MRWIAIVVIVAASIVFYTLMAAFSLLIAGKGRASTIGTIGMVVLWPYWVVPEAIRTGDPFLQASSVLFGVFVAFYVLLGLGLF